MTARTVIMVCPTLTGEALKATRALTRLDNMRVCAIAGTVPAYDALAAYEVVENPKSIQTLVRSAKRLSEPNANRPLLVTVHEPLLKPVAEANEAVGSSALTVREVERVLDKAEFRLHLKDACPASTVAYHPEEVHRFLAQHPGATILKPLMGGGGLGTWRVQSRAQLEDALAIRPPTVISPLIIEEALDGQEFSFDAVVIDGSIQLYSLCLYSHPILEAVERADLQWSCVLPRRMDGTEATRMIAAGHQAVNTLDIRTAIVHIEGFYDEYGAVRFVDATPRPAGARIGPMLGHAHDTNSHDIWAKCVAENTLPDIPDRCYAVGTVFLRGVGAGNIVRVEGLDLVKQNLGEHVVDAQAPREGSPKAHAYTGDGYVTVRHPCTDTVAEMLDQIATTISISYTEKQPKSENLWRRNLTLQVNHQYVPMWEQRAAKIPE